MPLPPEGINNPLCVKILYDYGTSNLAPSNFSTHEILVYLKYLLYSIKNSFLLINKVYEQIGLRPSRS